MWETRALELNNQEIWNWERVCEFIDYACRHDFTALVLGQMDLFDKLVSPAGYWPAHLNDRLSSQQRARCVYLERLGNYCHARGLRFYLQAKELSFQTDILLSHPQLLDAREGVRFDMEFWCRYLIDKVALICQRIASLDGLLIALSTTDSLLPISHPHWAKNRAAPANTPERYKRFFHALSEVMAREGRHLVLRVFPASNSDVDNVLHAISALPEAVSVSIKLTPERFWPEFPNNPALLAVTDRDVWVEIDLAGEEVGWGNFPFLRVDELQGRLLWCQEKNPAIRGALCKVSWEGIDNHWVIGSLSECNLLSCAYLLRHDSHPTVTFLLQRWLSQCYGWQPHAGIVKTLGELLEQGGQALYGALYARDHVFHRHSLLPESVDQALWSLYGQLDRNHWLPGSGNDLYFSRDDVNISSHHLYQIAKEKDAALALARDVACQAADFARQTDFPVALSRRWQTEWAGLTLYCQAFVCAQKAFFTLCYARQVENSWSMREICQINIQGLYSAAGEMADFCARHPDLPPGLYVMFDPRRVRQFAASLNDALVTLMT